MANSKSPLETSLPLPWVTLLLHVAFGPFCNSPSTCPEVARLLGDAPRSVENWVHSFEQHGLAWPTEGERSGRPSRLDEKQVKEINRCRAKPSDAGMRVNLWDGKTLSASMTKPMGSNWVCANASDCFGNSSSASVSLVRYWRKLIQRAEEA